MKQLRLKLIRRGGATRAVRVIDGKGTHVVVTVPTATPPAPTQQEHAEQAGSGHTSAGGEG